MVWSQCALGPGEALLKLQFQQVDSAVLSRRGFGISKTNWKHLKSQKLKNAKTKKAHRRLRGVGHLRPEKGGGETGFPRYTYQPADTFRQYNHIINLHSTVTSTDFHFGHPFVRTRVAKFFALGLSGSQPAYFL